MQVCDLCLSRWKMGVKYMYVYLYLFKQVWFRQGINIIINTSLIRSEAFTISRITLNKTVHCVPNKTYCTGYMSELITGLQLLLLFSSLKLLFYDFE